MTDLFDLLPKRGGSALIAYLRMTRPGY